MTRIAKSLLTIVAVAAIAVGATGAHFWDQESIAGNTFTAGTLNITVDNSVGKPFSVSDAYPGYQTEWASMNILNSPGTVSVETYIWLSQTGGILEFYNALEIDLKDSGSDFTCDTGDEVSIYSGLLSGITGQVNRNQTSNNYPNAIGTPGNDDIVAGNYQKVCQRLRLPITADNTLQGLSATFTETVDAESNNDF